MDSAKLPITGPCPIDLDAIGFDRSAKSAHCTHCVKSVHNLSNMTEGEAKAFLAEKAGTKICVSYARSRDGRVHFKADTPAPVVPLARLRRARPAALPAAAGLGLAVALAACTPVDNPDIARPPVEQRETPKAPEPHEVVAGGMMVAPPPVPEPVEVVDGEIEAPQVVEGEMIPELVKGETIPPVVAPPVPDVPPAMVRGEMAVAVPDADPAPCPGKPAPAPDPKAPPAGTMDPL